VGGYQQRMTRVQCSLRVAFVVQNASVPFDGRVWKEARALRDAGHEVVVVCPTGDEIDQAPHEVLEGIPIYRYTPRVARSTAGYMVEYLHAFIRIRALLRAVSRTVDLDVVHVANPPDFLLLTALAQRRRGVSFVFDQHDLAPEVFLARFGSRRSPLFAATAALERVAYRLADVVIVPNDSYRDIALARGGKAPTDVFVVRNGPDLSTFLPLPPDDRLKRGKQHLLVWVGLMAPQDGVDYALRALAHLRSRRSDWHAVIVGDGPARSDLEALSNSLRLGSHVDFTGMVNAETVRKVISTADVCLAADPKTPLNDVSTMIKTVEYMALGRPVVSFDLREARVSAGEAASYAVPNSEESFADCIGDLLDDPAERRRRGELGRERVRAGLSWDVSTSQLLAAYERLCTKDLRKTAP
jgi:glycosyltransferase involved in cell wall biosynthesis